MLSPDRLAPFEHALRNVAALMMAGMIQAFGGLMGDLGQVMNDAFSGGNSKHDVAAEIRESMNEEQRKLLADAQAEMQMDEQMRARILARVDDATADELLALLRGIDVGLPDLTQEMPPEALLGYSHLLAAGDERVTTPIGQFATRMEEITQSRTAAELEEEFGARLGSVSGSKVAVAIDRKTTGEAREAAPILDEVQSAFQWLSLDSSAKKARLAEIHEVRVRGVRSMAQRGFSLEKGALDVRAALSEEGGIPEGREIAEAITEQWTAEYQDRARAARAARAVSGPNGLSLEVAGLRVTAPMSPSDPDDLRPFHEEPGTTVAFVVRSANGGLIEFDSNQSTLAARDDSGRDLTASEDPSRSSAGFGSFPSIGPDGKACGFEIHLPELPAEGAEQLELELSLAFELANGTAESSGKVRFQDGAKFTVAGLPFQVASVESDDWGTRVNLASPRSLENVAGYRFVTSKGEAIECSVVSSSTMGGDDDIQEERMLSFGAPVEAGTLSIATWKDRKVVTWPVRVRVGLGM